MISYATEDNEDTGPMIKKLTKMISSPFTVNC
jgi:hypothetical protein